MSDDPVEMIESTRGGAHVRIGDWEQWFENEDDAMALANAVRGVVENRLRSTQSELAEARAVLKGLEDGEDPIVTICDWIETRPQIDTRTCPDCGEAFSTPYLDTYRICPRCGLKSKAHHFGGCETDDVLYVARRWFGVEQITWQRDEAWRWVAYCDEQMRSLMDVVDAVRCACVNLEVHRDETCAEYDDAKEWDDDAEESDDESPDTIYLRGKLDGLAYAASLIGAAMPDDKGDR